MKGVGLVLATDWLTKSRFQYVTQSKKVQANCTDGTGNQILNATHYPQTKSLCDQVISMAPPHTLGLQLLEFQAILGQ